MCLLFNLIVALKDNKIHVPFVKNKQQLIVVLEKINSLVGLTNFKEIIATKFKKITVNHMRGVEMTGFNNTIISGPPGVGKTMCAVLLAEFFDCLDLNPVKPLIETQELYLNKYTQRELAIIKKLNSLSMIMDMCKVLDPGKHKESLRYVRNSYQPLKITGKLPEKSGEVTFMNNVANYEPEVQKYMNIPSTEESNVKIVTRADLIGKYQGHTEDKIRTFLLENKGKTVVIDEAYILCTDKKDTYGFMLLTIINKYMDEHPNDIRWIFIGYEEELNSSIFTVQPGLKRRFSDTINISGYKPKELAQIMQDKLTKMRWSFENASCDVSDVIHDFIELNGNLFEAHAGSCMNISEKINEYFINDIWDKLIINDKDLKFSISVKALKEALNNIAKMTKKEEVEDNGWKSMFA